ncbi:MAG TPA: sulfite exporter TauE/SafE family protein [Dehalococcoidia bacterium]|nr:sulfite exporter TauE/SafE family protein [Dehalococcoidia bacterium]
MGTEFSAVVFLLKVAAASLAGGVIGSISGLGGGIVIVPVLTVFLGMPIQDAIGASIVSVIATSSGAGSVYVKDHLTNIRIAMFLEVGTAAGAIVGAAVLAPLANEQALAIIFGVTLLLSLIPIFAKIGEELPTGVRNDRLAARLRLNSSYFDKRLNRQIDYQVTGIPESMGIMFAAGIISGLLGIGAGVLKVLAHEIAMKVPSKVSTATSNFMIGVTAATAAGVYLRRGLVLPWIVVPVASSVLLGAFIGTKLMERMSNARVRQVFALALAVIGVEMLFRGLGVPL